MTSRAAMTNRPDVTEAVEPPAGCNRIQYAADTRVPNCGIFTLWAEDFTMANLLRTQLLRDPDVIFAGYHKFHPLEHNILVRVECKPASNPFVTFQRALLTLRQETESLLGEYRQQVSALQGGGGTSNVAATS